jgi:hypothetical protein
MEKIGIFLIFYHAMVKILKYEFIWEGVSIRIQINFMKQTFQCVWAVGKKP